MSQLIYMAGS